ncbi:MAG: hypothetical protein MR824_07025, partial [Fusobacterium mortiferum]|nr:hypothetical protein [Fusobacterium mortiferum]
EMKLRKLFEKDSTGKYLPLSGGIYIFGRVESDKDREWYRKQIYEFVQFMKQTGTFEYVALTFEIIDERILSSDFSNVKSEFEKKVNIAKRRELLSNVNPPSSQEKKEKMENLIRSEMSDFSGKLLLLYTQIYSEKYIKSNSLDREIKSYDNYKDVDFTIQWY